MEVTWQCIKGKKFDSIFTRILNINKYKRIIFKAILQYSSLSYLTEQGKSVI